MKVLIASSNMGKVAIYGEVLKEMGLEFISLRDLDINTYPEENGKDTRENAIIKISVFFINVPLFLKIGGCLSDIPFILIF